MSDKYRQPQPVTDLLMAFPATLGELLPPMSVIPSDYPNQRDWESFQSKWFYEGLPEDVEIYANKGVDPRLAFRHLATILRSYEPKHEHKEAAVAWLASRWLARVSTPDGKIDIPASDPKPE